MIHVYTINLSFLNVPIKEHSFISIIIDEWLWVICIVSLNCERNNEINTISEVDIQINVKIILLLVIIVTVTTKYLLQI